MSDGTRVRKDDDRVVAYGNLDELNAVLGYCRAVGQAEWLGPRIEQLQRELFCLGGELAASGSGGPSACAGQVGPDACRRLESWIDESVAAAEPAKGFILPGGSELACRLHLARTCCRRAERSVVTLNRWIPVRPEALAYLNRLGDLLFAWSCQANRQAGWSDVVWNPDSDS